MWKMFHKNISHLQYNIFLQILYYVTYFGVTLIENIFTVLSLSIDQDAVHHLTLIKFNNR